MTLAPVMPLRQNRSVLPSPSKSAARTTRQAWLVTATVANELDALAESQIASAPVLALRQNTSALPSPLKSPTAATFQSRFVTATTACTVEALPDFQITLAPVFPFRQKTSARPSPSKSPSPTTDHATGVAGSVCAVAALADRQTALAPEVTLCQKMSDRPSPSRSLAGRAACTAGVTPVQSARATIASTAIRTVFIPVLRGRVVRPHRSSGCTWITNRQPPCGQRRACPVLRCSDCRVSGSAHHGVPRGLQRQAAVCSVKAGAGCSHGSSQWSTSRKAN